METLTVVPSHAIEKLSLMPGVQYGRVGGMQYEYLGDRTFGAQLILSTNQKARYCLSFLKLYKQMMLVIVSANYLQERRFVYGNSF